MRSCHGGPAWELRRIVTAKLGGHDKNLILILGQARLWVCHFRVGFECFQGDAAPFSILPRHPSPALTREGGMPTTPLPPSPVSRERTGGGGPPIARRKTPVFRRAMGGGGARRWTAWELRQFYFHAPSFPVSARKGPAACGQTAGHVEPPVRPRRPRQAQDHGARRRQGPIRH